MSSKQNKPLTIGLCSEPGTGKTQYVYQFLSDVLALNAQSGANNELDGDAKQYYQKLSAEIEKGALSPTRDEKSFTVSLPEKTETSQDVNLKQYNFYDESGDSFVNYVEDDEKSDDIFNQLINNSDVLIYTINPASPEFVSETYFQTLQEHIHQLLKTIAKKRGNRYLPVYFLFTHQNDLDAASEDDKAVVQKQMDSLMAFVKQEYQNRYNRTFPRELASPKTAFGAFDLKRPGSALQVMEETLNLHACLEKFDKKFRARSRIVLIPFILFLFGFALAFLCWFLPKLLGHSGMIGGESLTELKQRISDIEEQLLDLNRNQKEFNDTISSINSNIDNIENRLRILEKGPSSSYVPGTPLPEPVIDEFLLKGGMLNSFAVAEGIVKNRSQIQSIIQRLEKLERGTETNPLNSVIDGEDKYGKFKKITYNGLTFAFRYCESCKANGFPMGREGINVKLHPGFWILESEVTNEMWETIEGNRKNDNGKSFPVGQVNWYECESFCLDLSEKINKACNTNFKFQLPTEAQWEYACRAGNTLKVPSDDKVIEIISDLAWYNKNSNNTVHAVKTKNPNAWGIYDMYGNVDEIVRDGWNSELVSSNNPIGTNDKDCVYRGGCYSDSCWRVNWHFRKALNKGDSFKECGFRICFEDEEPESKK